MGYFSRLFPYSNLHDLNLDWIVETIKKLEGAVDINADTGSVDKEIRNGNNLVYRFVVDNTGIKMVDPDTNVAFPVITWANKSMNLTKLLANNVESTYSKSGLYQTQGLFAINDSADNRVGVIELAANNTLQFWTKKTDGQPEHYRLPTPTADSPVYYDIMTSKTKPAFVNVTGLKSTVETTLMNLETYFHTVVLRLQNVRDSAYEEFDTIAVIPEGYRPSLPVRTTCKSATGETCGVIVNTAGEISLFQGESNKWYSGSLTYLIP